MLGDERMFKRYSDRILVGIAVLGFLAAIFSWSVGKFYTKPQSMDIRLTGLESVASAYDGQLKDHERRLTKLETRFQDSQDRIADALGGINSTLGKIRH